MWWWTATLVHAATLADTMHAQRGGPVALRGQRTCESGGRGTAAGGVGMWCRLRRGTAGCPPIPREDFGAPRPSSYPCSVAARSAFVCWKSATSFITRVPMA